MIVRTATDKDVREWFGSVPATMRAIVLEKDGQVIGIAGVSRMEDHMQAWSSIKDEARGHRIAMARAAVKFRQLLRECGGTVFAVCSDNEPTSPGLLAHLGFEPINGKVWRHG